MEQFSQLENPTSDDANHADLHDPKEDAVYVDEGGHLVLSDKVLDLLVWQRSLLITLGQSALSVSKLSASGKLTDEFVEADDKRIDFNRVRNDFLDFLGRLAQSTYDGFVSCLPEPQVSETRDQVREFLNLIVRQRWPMPTVDRTAKTYEAQIAREEDFRTHDLPKSSADLPYWLYGGH